jgi:antitoxin (DNA-binding transcriptional repressor) of toxin-antitoxin stability system
MKRAGSFYTKTHLSAILDEVAKGEVFEIMNRGKLVARIVPAQSSADHEQEQRRARAKKALDHFLSLKPKSLPKGHEPRRHR